MHTTIPATRDLATLCQITHETCSWLFKHMSILRQLVNIRSLCYFKLLRWGYGSDGMTLGTSLCTKIIPPLQSREKDILTVLFVCVSDHVSRLCFLDFLPWMQIWSWFLVCRYMIISYRSSFDFVKWFSAVLCPLNIELFHKSSFLDFFYHGYRYGFGMRLYYY